VGNAVHTNKHKQHWDNCQELFVPENFKFSHKVLLSDDYHLLHVDEYFGKVGERKRMQTC